MDGELTFDGIKYISSKRASGMSGYTQDYVGQLCRSGRLASKRVGRSWYVREDSLIAYINGEGIVSDGIIHERTDREALDLSEEVDHSPFERAWNDQVYADASETVAPAQITVTPKESPVSTFTNVRKDEHFFRGIMIPLIGITAVTVFVVLMGFASGGVFQKLALADVHSPLNGVQGRANALGGLTGPEVPEIPEHPAYTRLPFFVAGYSVVASYTQSVDRTISDEGGLLGVLSTSTPGASSGTIRQGGLFVTPSEGATKDALVIQQIANTFSDEVVVSPHEGGQSGLIRPVFRETRGDEYLYVLVPIDN